MWQTWKLGVNIYFHQIVKLPLQITLPETVCIKGALSGLRHFLATEIPLKTLKNVSYFTFKALSFWRYLIISFLDFFFILKNKWLERLE